MSRHFGNRGGGVALGGRRPRIPTPPWGRNGAVAAAMGRLGWGRGRAFYPETYLEREVETVWRPWGGAGGWGLSFKPVFNPSGW